MAAEPVHSAVVSTSTRIPGWVRLLPVLLLLVAIAAQGTLMATNNVDRQSGSGFAMFSSIDFAGSRSVVVTATLDGEPVQVAVPTDVDDQVDQLLRAPTESLASELAATLAQVYTWEQTEGRATIDGTGRLTNVRVAIRALTADGQQIRSSVIAQGSFG